jgi:hypothetical protein
MKKPRKITLVPVRKKQGKILFTPNRFIIPKSGAGEALQHQIRPTTTPAEILVVGNKRRRQVATGASGAETFSFLKTDTSELANVPLETRRRVAKVIMTNSGPTLLFGNGPTEPSTKPAISWDDFTPAEIELMNKTIKPPRITSDAMELVGMPVQEFEQLTGLDLTSLFSNPDDMSPEQRAQYLDAVIAANQDLKIILKPKKDEEGA